MSADSPPTYYFTGIQFNSSFYKDVSTSPLTQSEASALYLLKNTADTATALETFTAGILTNTINAVVSASDDITIGASQTDGDLNLGTGSSRTALGAINIGNIANASPISIAGASIKLAIGGSYGTGGQMLVSGGSSSATWTTTTQSGKVPNPTYSASTPGTVTFGTPYIGATSPSVILTVDTALGSTAIVLAGVAGFTFTGSGASTNWTGFNWFISTDVPGGYLNWIASPG
jgi:hypothetical protein